VAQVTDKSVAAAGQSLNVLRIIRVIPQDLSQFIHGGVQSVFEIDESIRRP
jgi:hypothetical protein